METPPMVSVEVVGVRNRRWILPKASGMALKTAMDSVVRAVGRIVVWVEAAAELSTIRRRRWERKLPNPEDPKMELPRTESTSPMLLGLERPMAFGPTPASEW